jgi:hypothetical protein
VIFATQLECIITILFYRLPTEFKRFIKDKNFVLQPPVIADLFLYVAKPWLNVSKFV